MMMMLTMKLFLHCAIFYLLTDAYGVNYDDKDRSSMLINPETDDIERQLFMMKKRGGARAFGPMRSNNYEHLFVPNIKRHQTLSPYYYYYQQPKRGGGHPFYTYLSENGGDGKFIEHLPFYKKRSLMHDSDDYAY
ncbi:Tryptophan synthase alpha chain [Dirofilaria immitis]